MAGARRDGRPEGEMGAREMGDSFQKLVDKDATADEAERLARRVLAYLVERGVVQPERSDCVLGARATRRD